MKIKLTGTNLVVNGETVEDGSRCEIGEAEALALIDRGLAVPDDGAAEPSSDDDRHALIVDAIRDLIESDPERADDSIWTKSGKPDIKALESLLGFDVTAAERDAAMAEAIDG